ncbi:PLP-dependent aminotransferase family protein [Modestobacter sp. Leaf380]|uniref:MocR-like pyridoxine biosynthesis transcription factor PdxR n=1 Tax=Modestobacter sp. Leaf380 TaxID=1736356 RepID=UPI0006FF06AB|nr:PLP-dependent aminotransferase family protein [Modestobacter sp. Leaf380]KQS73575.1 GntR family transcriptional regulator [Modestobacter sp. Leaf380]
MTEPPVLLDRRSGVPLAVQLADGLRSSPVLRVGDRLPSTRQLASTLGVSRTVTAAAYDQLLAEGWLEGRRGVGSFVVGTPPAAPVDRRSRPDPTPSVAVDLRPGAPCLEVLDRAAWRRAWRAAGDEPPDVGWDPIGTPAFRTAVVEHLLRHRGLPADPDDVLGTSGTSAGVAEVARLLPPGSRVGVEDPGYGRAVGALLATGVTVVPLRVDHDGLVVDEVPAGLAAVYCTPAHQFPLGGRLPAARRVALVEWARAEGTLVLEDDYDGELRYDVAPLPLLASLAPDVVVHLGTTSKVLSPTLGVGWLVAPRPLRDRLVEARTATGTRPARAGQRVLAALAGHGDLSRHLRRLRRELAARRDLVRGAVADAGHRTVGDAAGAHLVVPLADRATEERVRADALAGGVAVDGLARHTTAAGGPAGLVVGWAAPTRAELVDALAVLTGALRGVRP